MPLPSWGPIGASPGRPRGQSEANFWTNVVAASRSEFGV